MEKSFLDRSENMRKGFGLVERVLVKDGPKYSLRFLFHLTKNLTVS